MKTILRKWGSRLRLLSFSLALVPLSAGAGQQEAQKQDQPARIAEAHKLTITGRLLEDKSPVAGVQLTLIPVSEADLKTGTIPVTLRQGKASKLWNPTGRTDDAGKFTLVTDGRDWEDTGWVAIQAKLFRNLRNYEAILSNSASGPIVIRMGKDPEKLGTLDLGDVMFRVK